ncbi:hypothetical protein [Rhodovulum sulfidophilum]|uniref:Uncharacterized protein n=1 Tax=Rhodovulum sulfidophilum TaxID=35806 RepID=A0ABS1RV11_RHOSU|nr:hypothetical protein [Rhodovulum sulfidophilum]MBL3609931.1 hypothetical protein [Rhodovulum sulfidophilum]MCE8438569.1 hypothetical protein [Rhodovulum sulfidophilum]MCE8455336.1 hypothetical protein [Rhodovulum sulfidophilum]
MSDQSALQTAKVLWHLQRIKRLVRDRLGRGSAQLVSVRGTVCLDPGYPGPATEIRVVNLALMQTRFVIHKPADQVSAADVSTLL